MPPLCWILIGWVLGFLTLLGIHTLFSPKPKPPPPKLTGDIHHWPFHKSSPNNTIVDAFHLRDYLWVVLDYYQIERWRVSFLQSKGLLELSVHPLGVNTSQENKRVVQLKESELAVHPGDIRDFVWGMTRAMLVSAILEQKEGPICYLCGKRHFPEKPCCDLCGGRHHENDGCL